MSNTLSTIDMVAKEALRIAHEKATFVGTTTRSYDDSYAKTGAKIGDTLRLRNPNQYSVTTASRVMDAQDQEESTQSLTVASQYHVDMRDLPGMALEPSELAVHVIAQGIGEFDVMAADVDLHDSLLSVRGCCPTRSPCLRPGHSCLRSFDGEIPRDSRYFAMVRRATLMP